MRKTVKKAKGSKIVKRVVYWPAPGRTLGKSSYKPVREEFFDNWR